jgi:elongation factor G
VERSLRVLDGAILVLCGVGGVEPQTEKVWHQSAKYNIPRILYINKMDRIGSDYSDVINQLEEKFNAQTLLLHLPLGIEENFAGIIDLVNMQAYHFDTEEAADKEFGYEVIDIPEEYLEEAEMHREHLLEKISELDLEIMELYLEKETISEDVLKAAIRRICLERTGFPVVMGSSFKRKGVQNLLDAIVEYLPSPKDKDDVTGLAPKSGETLTRGLSDDEPFSAVIFKIMTDPYVGQLVYFRVYSGVAKSGGIVYNATKGEKVRLARLLKMHSNKREEVKEVRAGDIAATVGITGVQTGDTISDERHPIILESIKFPEPVVNTTIEPKLTSDHKKIVGNIE